jgi:6-phosphogluconolactonase (cycloisomerase 2 family)
MKQESTMIAHMTNMPMGFAAIALVALGLATTPAESHSGGGPSGAVYAMTNHPTGNTIAVFDRFADGSLQAAGEFPTGGLGTGGPSDPLRSQGSLILARPESSHHDSDDDDGDGDDDDGNGHDRGDDDHRGSASSRDLLFAVNAGSNEISVLAVEDEGLVLVDKVSSGGIRPTSVALYRRLLYVLNAGSGTISGFTVSRGGRLTALPDSTRPLTGGAAADPAQVGFSPDGRLLVVTGKMTNVIDTYIVGRDGRATGPRPNPSLGMTPFGFGFDRRGTLVVSEAFGGLPNQAAVSSYDLSRDGRTRVVSGSVRDLQTAACWIVITRNGKYVYTSNTGSSSVSSYRLDSHGRLRLRESVAASTDPGSAPIDMALTHRFLYVLNGVVGTVNGFRVESDGSLSPTTEAGGLPPYAQGIAAR